jgi:hypothetical protein
MLTNKKFVDTEELSAWSVGDGVIRIQTRDPEAAEVIARLADTWSVGESYHGDYLRLFHTTQPQRKVQRTLNRILARISSQGRRAYKPQIRSQRDGADTGQRTGPQKRAKRRTAVKTAKPDASRNPRTFAEGTRFER